MQCWRWCWCWFCWLATCSAGRTLACRRQAALRFLPFVSRSRPAAAPARWRQPAPAQSLPAKEGAHLISPVSSPTGCRAAPRPRPRPRQAPFCVHPKTGKVCVPIDPDTAWEFDPGGDSARIQPSPLRWSPVVCCRHSRACQLGCCSPHRPAWACPPVHRHGVHCGRPAQPAQQRQRGGSAGGQPGAAVGAEPGGHGGACRCCCRRPLPCPIRRFGPAHAAAPLLSLCISHHWQAMGV